MKIMHRADTRGTGEHGWLHSRYTFSFADYFDRHRMHFGALRVINDDTIEPGYGFSMHSHRDMEIISIPLKGSLRHKDNTGHEEVIEPGEVQVMSAGTGIAHSEFNASTKEPVSLLQIWILPERQGVNPRYDQSAFSQAGRKNQPQLVVSPDGRLSSLAINQQAFISLMELGSGMKAEYEPYRPTSYGVYFFVINGGCQIASEPLTTRDGIGLVGATSISLASSTDSFVLILEVPSIK